MAAAPCPWIVGLALVGLLLLGPGLGAAHPTPPGPWLVVTIDVPFADLFGGGALDDLNDHGVLIGGSAAGPIGVRLTPGFGVTLLTCPGAEQATAPKAITNTGAIAGFCTNADGLHGFVRAPRGRLRLLDVPGATATAAMGLNDAGQVVGDFRAADGTVHGFLWRHGHFRTLDVDFPGATATFPTAINSRGHIAGYWFDDQVSPAFPNGHVRGFLYAQGVFRSLEAPGADETLLLDLNDQGQLVGVGYAPAPGVWSFLWDQETFVPLDFRTVLPNLLLADVSGLNNLGQVVGHLVLEHPPGTTHALGFVAAPVGPEVGLPLPPPLALRTPAAPPTPAAMPGLGALPGGPAGRHVPWKLRGR